MAEKTLTLEQKVDKILAQNEALAAQVTELLEQQESIIEALNNLSREGADFEEYGT